MFWKGFLEVRSSFFGVVLSLSLLGFVPTSFGSFFLRERQNSGSHRSHPTPYFLVLFLFPFLFPPRSCCVLAVRPFFLAFCRGAFLGPVRFCDFRILSELQGAWDYSPLLRPSFWTRGGKGVLVDSFCCFCFPFCCVCGCFTQTRKVEPSSCEPYPRSSYPPRVRGAPSSAKGWSPRWLPRSFFCCPFFTRTFLFPPQVLFWGALGARCRNGQLGKWYVTTCSSLEGKVLPDFFEAVFGELVRLFFPEGGVGQKKFSWDFPLFCVCLCLCRFAQENFFSPTMSFVERFVPYLAFGFLSLWSRAAFFIVFNVGIRIR